MTTEETKTIEEQAWEAYTATPHRKRAMIAEILLPSLWGTASAVAKDPADLWDYALYVIERYGKEEDSE